MKKQTLLFSCLLLLSACEIFETGNNNQTLIHFPLLRECKSEVIKSLEKFYDKNKSFKYKITEFDIILDSHPNITGVVEISDVLPKEFVIGIANGPILNCYPIASFSYSLDNNIGHELIRDINFRSRAEQKYFYSVIENNKLLIFYNSNKEK